MVNDNTYNPNLSLSQAYSWGQMQRVSANLTKKYKNVRGPKNKYNCFTVWRSLSTTRS